MRSRAFRLALAALLLAGCAGGFTATGPPTSTRAGNYRVEITPGKDDQGRAAISGYVYGGGGRPRVLVESLDAAGNPIGSQLVFVSLATGASHRGREVTRSSRDSRIRRTACRRAARRQSR